MCSRYPEVSGDYDLFFETMCSVSKASLKLHPVAQDDLALLILLLLPLSAGITGACHHPEAQQLGLVHPSPGAFLNV